jgi:hypothetical protein
LRTLGNKVGSFRNIQELPYLPTGGSASNLCPIQLRQPAGRSDVSDGGGQEQEQMQDAPTPNITNITSQNESLVFDLANFQTSQPAHELHVSPVTLTMDQVESSLTLDEAYNTRGLVQNNDDDRPHTYTGIDPYYESGEFIYFISYLRRKKKIHYLFHFSRRCVQSRCSKQQ